MMGLYEQVVEGILPLDPEVIQQARCAVDSLLKPIGSLGKLEKMAIQLAGISGTLRPQVKKSCLVLMSADNGVCAEGVSSCPQELTLKQTINFTKGMCGINVLTRHAGMDLRVVDVGINVEFFHPGVIDKKVRLGTANMAYGPAMTRAEAIQALKVGIEMVGQLAAEGYQAVGTGEMGVGNTATSSAILMAFTGCSAEIAVGKGAGLTEESYQNKKRIIERALQVNQPDANAPIDVLSKVGGLDIAGMAGCFLGAAYYRLPIIVDGFISAAAALVACKINPLARYYMFPSHYSAEPGFKLVMQELQLSPMLHLEMRLGEGTGCPLALQLMDAATKVMTEMATFADAAIDTDYLIDIR